MNDIFDVAKWSRDDIGTTCEELFGESPNEIFIDNVINSLFKIFNAEIGINWSVIKTAVYNQLMDKITLIRNTGNNSIDTYVIVLGFDRNYGATRIHKSIVSSKTPESPLGFFRYSEYIMRDSLEEEIDFYDLPHQVRSRVFTMLTGEIELDEYFDPKPTSTKEK